MGQGIRRVAVVLCGLLLGLGLAASAGAAEPGTAAKKPPKPDMIMKGDAKCTSCHDETEEYPVLSIAKTKHGVRADERTPTCTSCHGESESHINIPPGSKERPRAGVLYGAIPTIPVEQQVERFFGYFGKNTPTPVAERNAPCLNCHKGGNRMHWAGSQHANADLACTSCHQIHTRHDRVRDKLTQSEICFTCHKEQRAQTFRASTHPLRAGKMACSNCHNPHGTTGPKLLAKNSVNETCYTCHAERRGPFLWEHPPASDNCLNCHTPHGSNHAPLLKARPPFLCQSCHDFTQHPGNPYSGRHLPVQSGGLAPAQQLLLRGCPNCHTQVHGTNHPSGPRYTR